MTRLDIFNMALGMVGTRQISSANENSPEAMQCNLYYDRARRGVLQDFPFGFAVRRLALKPAQTQGEICGHAYDIPEGCLKVLRVWGINRPDSPTAFYMEQAREGMGQVIVCTVSNACATCVFDVTDTALFSERFVRILVARLACSLSIPLLKNNPARVRELTEIYQSYLPSGCTAVDMDFWGEGMGVNDKEQDTDTWLRARNCW